MSATNVKAMLAEMSFSAELPDDVLGKIASLATVERFAAGDVLFREGTENRNLYLVHEGQVALDMCVPARGCLRILSLGPGDMLGWSALVGDAQMTTTATAVEDTVVVAVAADGLRQLCDADHELGYRVMNRMARAVSRRLVATRLQLLDLFSSDQLAARG